MQAKLHFSGCIPSRDLVNNRRRFWVVDRADHGAGHDHDESREWIVLHDVRGIDRAIETDVRTHEIRNWDRESVCCTQRSVVSLVNRSRAIGVRKPSLGCSVAVRRVPRGQHGESCRASLSGRAKDSLHVAEEGNPRSPKRKPLVERTSQRNVIAVLRSEDVE